MNRPDRSQSAHDDAELDHTYRPLSGKRHVLQDEPANYRYHQEETVQEMPLYDPEEEYQSDCEPTVTENALTNSFHRLHVHAR